MDRRSWFPFLETGARTPIFVRGAHHSLSYIMKIIYAVVVRSMIWKLFGKLYRRAMGHKKGRAIAGPTLVLQTAHGRG